MAIELKTEPGEDWTDRQNDLIVATYLEMLGLELAGKPFVKLPRAVAVSDATGRSRKSVEFKLMNVSAVFEELGLPTIRGYKAAPHFQTSLTAAVERALPTVLKDPNLIREPTMEPGVDVFVEAPAPFPARRKLPTHMQQLVRAFDPVARDYRNRELGVAGERFVLGVEKRRLEARCPDRVPFLKWVAKEDGDGAGFDIRSFDDDGNEMLIEVKTTYGSRTTPFFVTANERQVSEENTGGYHFYRVFDFSKAPRIFTLRPPLGNTCLLEPTLFRASLRPAASDDVAAVP